jgi:hypothetical protein
MTESKTAVILPVERETTMVAEVRRPPTTARDEVKTAMAGMSESISKWVRTVGEKTLKDGRRG